MYQVLKAIHFSYGHRLLHHPGKCARLHGHNGRVVIEVSSPSLNTQAMVMDFYEIRKIVETWIDQHLDHRMILSEADPLAAVLHHENEEVVVLNENPTAEVLAKLIFDEALKRGIPVTKVTLWETEDSAAAYSEERKA